MIPSDVKEIIWHILPRSFLSCRIQSQADTLIPHIFFVRTLKRFGAWRVISQCLKFLAEIGILSQNCARLVGPLGRELSQQCLERFAVMNLWCAMPGMGY